MAIVVNTNIQSLFAQRALGMNTMALQKSTERLSTGKKINKGADDAAGLSIAQKMTATIKGLGKATQNAQDGVSLIQTTEGALSVVQDNLQRIRELMVQGLNGTNGTDERDAMQREINERVTTIDDIAQATEFNGTQVLLGAADITLQTGADAGQTTAIALNDSAADTGIDIDITATTANGQLSEGAGIALNKLRITGATVASQDGTAANAGGIADIDTMIDNVSRMRSYLGAVQNGLDSKIEFLQIAAENVTSSRSRIEDADIAQESSVLVKNQILQQSAAAMLGQANSAPQLALNLLP